MPVRDIIEAMKKPKATYTYKEVRSILLELRNGTWPNGAEPHLNEDVLYFVNVINAFERKGVVVDPHRKPSPNCLHAEPSKDTSTPTTP